MREASVVTGRLAAVALAAVLAGCAAGVATHAPAPLEAMSLPDLTPSRSASLQASLAIERWWTVFADPALDLQAQSSRARARVAVPPTPPAQNRR